MWYLFRINSILLPYIVCYILLCKAFVVYAENARKFPWPCYTTDATDNTTFSWIMASTPTATIPLTVSQPVVFTEECATCCKTKLLSVLSSQSSGAIARPELANPQNFRRRRKKKNRSLCKLFRLGFSLPQWASLPKSVMSSKGTCRNCQKRNYPGLVFG